MAAAFIIIFAQALFGLFIVAAFVYILIDQIRRHRKETFTKRDN